MSFDARWREFARSARADERNSLSLAQVARHARAREPEPIPFVSSHVGAVLALAALVLTFALAPIVFEDGEALARLADPRNALLPRPPALPRPPSIEAPSYYVAAANAVWKDLQP